MEKNNLPKIIFAHCQQQTSYSETFIRNQFEYLPFDFKYIFVNNQNTIFYKNRLIQDQSGFWSLNKKIKRKLVRKSYQEVIFNDNLKFLKSLKPEAILAQYGPTGSNMVQYAKALNIPLIVHFHGFDSGRKQELEKFNNYKELFSINNSIIAVSKAMKAKLISLGATAQNVHHICYGIDYNLFKVKQEYRGQQILCVGTFTDKKAPQITLYAFSKVLEKNSQAVLAMVGEGPLFDSCKKLAHAMGIIDSVRFLGIRNSTEIASLMQESLIFAQHSLTPDSGDTEGTPLAILEAMSSGLPIVSTRHAGIQDVVKENETGYLVNEGDANAMAEHMLTLLNDLDLCRQYGQKGREVVEGNYGLQRYLGDLTELVQDNLKN